MPQQECLAGEREMEVVRVIEIDAYHAQVLLREKAGRRVCALRCDIGSAIGIDEKLAGRIPQQMHVQELVRRVMQETGTRLVRVLLFGGEGRYVWGRLFLLQYEREFTIDCRAADAIAQAQRWKLPLMMDELVLDESDRHAREDPRGLGPPAGNA